jgi:hypothetical protein
MWGIRSLRGVLCCNPVVPWRAVLQPGRAVACCVATRSYRGVLCCNPVVPQVGDVEKTLAVLEQSLADYKLKEQDLLQAGWAPATRRPSPPRPRPVHMYPHIYKTHTHTHRPQPLRARACVRAHSQLAAC